MTQKLLGLITGIAIIVILMPILISVFNLPIIGFSDIDFMLIKGNFSKFVFLVNYWVPFSFILGCISLILLTRYFNIIWAFIKQIIDWIRN